MLLLNLGWIIAYLNRINLSAAIIPIAAEKSWDTGMQGYVLSAFFYGYAPFQLPIGWVVTRVGPKRPPR